MRPAWMTNTAGDWLDQWCRGMDPDINERTEPSVNTPNLNPNPYPTSTYTDKDTEMNINNAFPSRWLKSGDIEDGADMILTIKGVEIETVGQGEDSEEKPVLAFTETEKGLVLNKTNAGTIAAMYGPETDGWTGKKIALFSTEVQFGSKMTVALRVRTKAPKAGNGTGDSLSERYAALVAKATALHLVFPVLDPAASDAETTAAGIALKAMIEAAAKQPAF